MERVMSIINESLIFVENLGMPSHWPLVP